MDIKTAKKDLIDAEARLDHVRSSMDALEKEIDTLSTLEIQLMDNLSTLKKKKTIALAREFKKVTQDLAKTRRRLEMLRSDREAYRAAHIRSEDLIEKRREALELALKQKSGKNVLHVEFGSPSGQE